MGVVVVVMGVVLQLGEVGERVAAALRSDAGSGIVRPRLRPVRELVPLQEVQATFQSPLARALWVMGLKMKPACDEHLGAATVTPTGVGVRLDAEGPGGALRWSDGGRGRWPRWGARGCGPSCGCRRRSCARTGALGVPRFLKGSSMMRILPRMRRSQSQPLASSRALALRMATRATVSLGGGHFEELDEELLFGKFGVRGHK